MIGTVPILYGLILVLGLICVALFMRVIVLHTSIRRLRRAIAKLEGTPDSNPEDAEEDELGTGDE